MKQSFNVDISMISNSSEEISSAVIPEIPVGPLFEITYENPKILENPLSISCKGNHLYSTVSVILTLTIILFSQEVK